MTSGRARQLTLAVLAAAAAGLLLPAAAAAAPLHAPLALFGIDVGQLVEDIVKGLVDLIVPDFAAKWASGLVTWLVAIPDVNSAASYPNLNGFRRTLTGVGYALLSLSFTASMVWVSFGDTRGLDALRRTAIAAIVLVTYPQLCSTAIRGVNLLTASAIQSPDVIKGLDTALGGALAVGVITSGFSLGLAVAAAIGALYFIAALLVMKIGLTTLQAVAMIAGSLLWGLYPLRGAAWLARAWTAGLTVVLLVPIGWAIVFSSFALLSSDALVFTGTNGLGAALQNIVKPFAAMACLWIAYKTPAFMLSTARAFGIQPNALISGGAGAGGARTGSGPGASPAGRVGQARAALSGGPAGVAKGVISTNADRFRAIGSRAAIPARAATRGASAASRRVGARAVVGVGRLGAPVAAQAAIAAGLPGSARVKTASKTSAGTAKAARAARRAASAPGRANAAWRALPGQPAARRRAAHSDPSRPGGPGGPGTPVAPAGATTPGGKATAPPSVSAGAPSAATTTDTKSSRAAAAAGAAGGGAADRGAAAPVTPRRPTARSGGPSTTAPSRSAAAGAAGRAPSKNPVSPPSGPAVAGATPANSSPPPAPAAKPPQSSPTPKPGAPRAPLALSTRAAKKTKTVPARPAAQQRVVDPPPRPAPPARRPRS